MECGEGLTVDGGGMYNTPPAGMRIILFSMVVGSRKSEVGKIIMQHAACMHTLSLLSFEGL